MRFKYPPAHSRRNKTWFAILPVYAEGEWRWLEWVTVEQRYIPAFNGSPLNGMAWRNDHFIDGDERRESEAMQ